MTVKQSLYANDLVPYVLYMFKDRDGQATLVIRQAPVSAGVIRPMSPFTGTHTLYTP